MSVEHQVLYTKCFGDIKENTNNRNMMKVQGVDFYVIMCNLKDTIEQKQ